MSSENFKLPPAVKICVAQLNQNRFEAFLVGGCVRDYLLRQEAKDIDVATDASPAEVIRIFNEYKTIATGLKHGTVTVIIHATPIEITTYRTGKEPMSNLAADLAKRDFTINALAYHEQTGVIDYHHGIEDLKNGIIRCVGNPKDRFTEDGLRILRAMRFASVLGFEIEAQTQAAMFAQKNLLAHVAKERIAAELLRLLCGEKARQIITEYVDILGVFIPDLLAMKGFKQNNIHHVYDVLTHTAVAVSNLPPIPRLRLAGLLHDIGKPQTYHPDENGTGHFYGHQELSSRMAQKILRELKLDSFTIERVSILIKYHDFSLDPKRKQIKRWLNKLSPEVFQELLILKRADILAQNPEFIDRLKVLQEIENLTQVILAEQSCFTLKNLNINGHDLIKLGVKPGKQVGVILNQLLEMVIDEQIENDSDSLTQCVLNIKGIAE
ncbi:MAG: HD domain-containing protein [Firmicutes bacterium]|nr:HD domain-containing protein [Bacillota bacterium]